MVGVSAVDSTPSDTRNAEELLKKAARYVQEDKPLAIGSDVELAGRVGVDLQNAFNGRVVYCEGDFLFYNGKRWEAIQAAVLRRFVQKYDGVKYGARNSVVRLGTGKINSVLTELSSMLAAPDWFKSVRVGVNCQNGFVVFDEDGTPTLEPHSADHRQRHVLGAEYGATKRTYAGSLFEKLLSGCFFDDPEAEQKIKVLSEVAGATVLGYGPKLIDPKAVVLLGPTAENGKSRILGVLRGLLPETAVSTIPPTTFADERYLVRLVGKQLNTSDELGSAGAIGADIFKRCITGDPVSARDVYASAIEFCPTAQHVFACNRLPAFQGGMDRGVLRRLVVVLFNRTIPYGERIDGISEMILRDELDLVLGFAIKGAARLLKRRSFSDVPSSRVALSEWSQSSDVVLAWLSERTVRGEALMMKTAEAYFDFKWWASAGGYRLPAINTFSTRLRETGLEYKHSGGFKGFVGLRVKRMLED
ncbi:MAG TPA: DUF5906 domain-containing protein [Bradyrhizobium sp.]|nr:DUF5906 domain-containing protein [Bradyrhizobium sp.]